MGIAGISLPGCGLEKATSPTSFSANDLHPESNQWNAVRSHFNTLGGLSYMNNASIGMPPAVVVQAVADGYRAQSEDPIHAKHQLQASIRDQVLPRLGQFFGTMPSELTLTRNASMALHIQAVGLGYTPWRRGDHHKPGTSCRTRTMVVSEPARRYFNQGNPHPQSTAARGGYSCSV